MVNPPRVTLTVEESYPTDSKCGYVRIHLDDITTLELRAGDAITIKPEGQRPLSGFAIRRLDIVDEGMIRIPEVLRDRLDVSVGDTVTIAHEKYSLTPESLDNDIL
ncbi:hypothetical protein [Haladaptatus sp. R4]|uniref:hypothetical protein n=1 Tax=Haladaptatus sp. R4 TaxID=1679489 RepID=UPI0009ED3A0B|nr:hypothetical protein [Haladaptatus sp. R4]